MATITILYDTSNGKARIDGDTDDTPGTDNQKRVFLRKFGLHFPIGGDNMGTWVAGGLYSTAVEMKTKFEAVFTSDTLVITKVN